MSDIIYNSLKMGEKKKGSKMGRPQLPPEDRGSERITIRLKPAQRAVLVREAKKRGITLTALIHERLGIEE